MNIEWVRSRVRDALADTLIAENGQLGNLAESTRVETSRFNRNPPRFLGRANGRMVRVPSSPVKAKQARVKGKSAILMHEYDYPLAPWRRAICSLDEPLQAWIGYCYGDYRYHAEQLKVVPYVWRKFIEQQPGRISGKVKQRLQGLALLAVQVVAREIDGRPDRYTYAELADMVGVAADTCRKRYATYWCELVSICKGLDVNALGIVEMNIRRKVNKNSMSLQMSGFCL